MYIMPPCKSGAPKARASSERRAARHDHSTVGQSLSVPVFSVSERITVLSSFCDRVCCAVLCLLVGRYDDGLQHEEDVYILDTRVVQTLFWLHAW